MDIAVNKLFKQHMRTQRARHLFSAITVFREEYVDITVRNDVLTPTAKRNKQPAPSLAVDPEWKPPKPQLAVGISGCIDFQMAFNKVDDRRAQLERALAKCSLTKLRQVDGSEAHIPFDGFETVNSTAIARSECAQNTLKAIAAEQLKVYSVNMAELLFSDNEL